MILLTFFDETYRAQGRCMLRSFMQHASERVKPLVLWLGDKPSDDRNIEVVTLKQFMNERLCKARGDRSWKSFCWTLEPALVYSCLKAQPDGEIIVYCDADSYWFADPVPAMLAAMEHVDVALSRHYFPFGQEHRERAVGKFNFGLSVMRACDLTRQVVGEWLDQTLIKCDESAGGDQPYLDLWPDKLKDRLAELPESMNWGPWRLTEMSQHPIEKYPMLPVGPYDKMNGQRLVTLISAHMHEFRRGGGLNPVTINGQAWNRSNYPLCPATIEAVYLKYESALTKYV